MQELKNQHKTVYNIDINNCRYFNGSEFIKVKHDDILYIYDKKTRHISKIIDLTTYNYK